MTPHPEPVWTVVGDAHGVVIVLEGDDHQHRAEDLLLGDGHRVVHVGEQGGLDVVALVGRWAGRPPPTTTRGPLGLPLLDVARIIAAGGR